MSMKREIVDETKIETSGTDGETNSIEIISTPYGPDFIQIDGIQYLVGADVSNHLNNNDLDSEVSE